MRLIAALTAAPLMLAGCDMFGPVVHYQPPAVAAPASQVPATTPGLIEGYATPVLPATRADPLSQPYPSQQQVLQQQQFQLNQGISQQATSRDSLSQQLQRGTMLDQINQSNLQQQINLDRTRP